MEIVFYSIPLSELLTNIEEIVRKVLSEKTEAATPPEDDELITLEKVRNILKVSRTTLNVWTEEGIVPGYRIGTRLRYKRSEVLAALGKVQKGKR